MVLRPARLEVGHYDTGRGPTEKGGTIRVINAMQKQLAWLVDYGSVDTILTVHL